MYYCQGRRGTEETVRPTETNLKESFSTIPVLFLLGDTFWHRLTELPLGSPIKTNLTRPSLNGNYRRACADLSVLLVRRGVVGDLEEVQVDHFFHLVVVSSTLAHDHRRIKQEDVPAGSRASSESHYF